MKQYLYQKNQRYFAQTAGGLEALSVKELEALGAKQIKSGFRGVYFTADMPALFRINYRARFITRVLAPLVSFQCRNRNDLYRAGLSVRWQDFFSTRNTFGIFANVSNNSRITHSQFAALCLKDAVADYFRQKTGKRPDVDKMNPDVWVNLHIEKENGTISLDVSGGSLHRRGYRQKSVEAPMQETLAAAIIAHSGWNGERRLYDPMCGSGTLLSEALMHYCRIPAGFLRKDFGFRHLPDSDEAVWEKVKHDADRQIRELPMGLIAGSDEAAEATEAVRTNCALLPDGDLIKISRKDFREITGLENCVIVCNPPYGIRLKKEANLSIFFKDFGDFLKQKCKDATAYIYFGNREMIKEIGLKAAWKKPMRNAGLDGRLVRYDLY